MAAKQTNISFFRDQTHTSKQEEELHSMIVLLGEEIVLETRSTAQIRQSVETHIDQVKMTLNLIA